MDLVAMAQRVKDRWGLEKVIESVTGPFGPGGEAGQSVEIMLRNGYGVRLSGGGVLHHGDNLPELMVRRRINDPSGTVADYANPVTDDTVRNVNDSDVAEALRKLSVLHNDPYDLRERSGEDGEEYE